VVIPMSSDGNVTNTPGAQAPGAPSPMQRKRIQKAFEHAKKLMGQHEYDYTYVSELLAQCVTGDPSNVDYITAYIENLHRKFNNSRPPAILAQFKERAARAAMKKAEAQGQWEEVYRNGAKVLTANPWDVATLRSMATAAKQLGHVLCEMRLLKFALEANPKDPETNIQCAKALAELGQYDQAIACWHRVEQARPDDEEVQRAIAELTVRKHLARTKRPDEEAAEKKKKAAAAAKAAGAKAPEEEEEISQEELLRERIARDPKNLQNYFELAQIYINRDDYKEAEAVYAKALEISGGEVEVQERWEDVQLRRLRQELMEVKKRRDNGEPGADEQYQRLRKELNDRELEVYKNRCERYPNNLTFKYELGLRYQIGGQINEAIKQFQIARNDPRRKGVCMLSLGQCFQQIKQYRLAMSHYEAAIEEIPDRDAENKKRALYQAGKLAFALSDLDAAEKHLSALAGLDFSYRDVSTLLDKIAAAREAAVGGQAPAATEQTAVSIKQDESDLPSAPAE